jgi:succinylglutamate desuccinylase
MKILLNICTHGNEKIGVAVAREVKKLNIKGELLVNIANERAFKLNKRFIDQDLNRSFPGKQNGNYEERRAYELLPMVKSADIVFDIHSTTSQLKDALIINKLNKKILAYASAISPKYVLVMRVTKKTALTANAKIGLAFEYGKDKDPEVVKKIVEGMKSLFVCLKILDCPMKKNNNKPIFFDVYKSVPKPQGAKLDKKIKNYKIVKKGQVYATFKNEKIEATSDFYPILFGEKNYKDIFGFAAKKLN